MAEWIDATRQLTDGLAGWPGDHAFTVHHVAWLSVDSTNLTEFRTSTHIGTHVDAPLHCFDDGRDVASLPLDRLCGSAVLLDIVGTGDVGIADLASVDIRPGDRVLLRTPNRHLWPLPGTAAGAAMPMCFQAITIDAARWLVDRGVVLVGIDYLSPDRPEATDLPVHRILLGAGVILVENLNLDDVPAGRYELCVLPLPIVGAEAAPARVLLRRADRR
jgi:arylformamidase